MLSKLTITLATLLMFGAASDALAQGEFDPNRGNRYPAFNEPFMGDRYDGARFPATRVAPSRYRDVGLPFSTRAPRATRPARDEAATGGGGY